MTWPRVPLDFVKSAAPYSFVGGPFGSELTTRDYVAEGIPVIRGSNLVGPGKFLDDDFVYVNDQKAASLRSNTAHPGDLIFTQRGTLGQIGLIPKHARFSRYVVSQSQMKLTVDEEKADPLFLYYFFRLPSTIQQMLNRVSSSGVPHINLSVLKAFEIPLPPKPTQEAIARIAQPYDDLIENNRRRIRLLEEAARLLYQEWFVRFRFPGHEHVKIVKGLPEGWQRRTFNEVCIAVGGGTPSTRVPEYWDGDITWVVPTDVTRNGSLALLDSERRITDRGLRESSAQMLPPETILMTSRASVGFFALPDAPVCTNQGFINIIPKIPECRFFLLHNLLSRVDEIRAHAAGSTYPEISKSRFRSLPIILPPENIRREFADTVKTSHVLVRNLELAIKKLNYARDLLLPRLMSGEVEV